MSEPVTPISTLPSAWALLDAALRARYPVHVSYHGRCRLICPHALGWIKGRPMVLGYQSGGQTTSGALDADPRKRWRCMFVDEVDQVTAAEPAGQWQTADNYNSAHPFAAIDEVAVAVGPSARP